MQITCASCSAKIRVPDSAAGKRVKCPRCATILSVPAKASKPPAQQGPVEPTKKKQTPEPRPKPAPPPVPAEDSSGTGIAEKPGSLKRSPNKSKRDHSEDDDEPDEDRSRRRRRDEADDDPDAERPRRRRRYDEDDEDDEDEFEVRRRRRPIRQVNGLAMTSMIMGIVSVSFLIVPICCCGLLGCGILSTITGGLAMTFGFMGKVPGSETHALTGIVCGGVAIGIGLLEIAFGVLVIGAHLGMMNF